RGDAGIVVIEITRTADDLTADVGISVVSTDGGVKRAATIDKAFFATLKLAPSRSAVYVTRSENGIHNLFLMPLSGGAMQRITDNTLTGVTFSGVEPLGGDTIIGVRDERKTDIYLIEKKQTK